MHRGHDMPARTAIIIALDAADWRVLSPLIDAGCMPNLTRVIESGSSGRLLTIDPVGSTAAWATLLTGQGAHVHGVLSDMVATGDTEGMRPVAMTDRAVPVVWEAAESAGIRALAVAPCWPRRSVPPRRLRRCALLLSRTLRMPRPCAGWPRCSCGNWGTSRPARPPCARRRGSCVRSGRVAARLGPGAASGLKVRPASWALHRSQRRAHRHRASAAPCTCDAREAEQGDGTWSRNGGKVQVADSGIHV